MSLTQSSNSEKKRKRGNNGREKESRPVETSPWFEESWVVVYVGSTLPAEDDRSLAFLAQLGGSGQRVVESILLNPARALRRNVGRES